MTQQKNWEMRTTGCGGVCPEINPVWIQVVPCFSASRGKNHALITVNPLYAAGRGRLTFVGFGHGVAAAWLECPHANRERSKKKEVCSE